MNLETNEASIYQYNGLGHRVGKTIGAPVKPTLPTSQYHNLLERREVNHDTNVNNNMVTSYTWDSNVLHAVGSATGATKRNTSEQNHYQYLQDDLGSPIRVLSEDNVEYEVYGYDEFGQETINIHNHGQGQGRGSLGFIQPFTYTGYQKDNIANTYYAQTREYTPSVGRFAGEDVIKETSLDH